MKWTTFCQNVKSKYDHIRDTIQKTFDDYYQKFPVRKDFAFQARKHNSFFPILFLLFEEPMRFTSVEHYLVVCEDKLFFKLWKEFYPPQQQ